MSHDPDQRISLRDGSRYLSIDYGEFLLLCRTGVIQTWLKRPGGKRRVTTRAACDRAQEQWDRQSRAGRQLVERVDGHRKPAEQSKYAGLKGRDIWRAQGL
jgi:hypothetical protein